jgi:hypothetical protein
MTMVGAGNTNKFTDLSQIASFNRLTPYLLQSKNTTMITNNSPERKDNSRSPHKYISNVISHTQLRSAKSLKKEQVRDPTKSQY